MESCRFRDFVVPLLGLSTRHPSIHDARNPDGGFKCSHSTPSRRRRNASLLGAYDFTIYSGQIRAPAVGPKPVRGFAFAWFKIGNGDVGVYSIHLKSNLITHGDREAETAKNIQKREIAITQLLTHVHDVVSTAMPAIKRVVIAGDFNTNHDQDMFAGERTLDSLATAGYQNGFEGLALSERVTHPGNHGFPDATFDFVFAKGLKAMQPSITRTTASDHWPVTRNFRLL